MTTLAEHMIVAGADNRPHMLEKSMYDSCKSLMLLYIQGKEHGRMILNSVKIGPLVWGTIELDGVTRPKTYEELSEKEKLQDDCDDLIACLNKAIAFMLTVIASRFPSTNKQLRTSSNLRNQATIQDGRGYCSTSTRQTQLEFCWAYGKTDDLDAYDSDCDDISSEKAVLMATLSSYDLDVLSEVPHHATYQNDDMINQSVQEMQYSKQSLIDYVPDNDITSDSNIISYE
ncbi:hypothetical protein Tco_0887854 [Tanacetum coccineum]